MPTTEIPHALATRFVALDVHRQYLMVGAVDSQQQVVLSPRRFGFAAFAESGNVFDPELAAHLKTIYSAGDTRDPMELYRALRGRDPKIDALLEQRGLTAAK